jgi:hypothetical protein
VLSGIVDRLVPISGASFGEYPIDMSFDGVRADEKGIGDLRIAKTLGDEGKDFNLADGKTVWWRLLRRRGRRIGPRCCCSEKGGLDVVVKDGLATRRCVERSGDVGTTGVLGEVPAGPGVQSGDDRTLVGEGGEHDDGDVGVIGGDPTCRFDTVELRHVKVDQCRIGMVLGDEVEGLEAIGGGSDNADIGEQVEHNGQYIAHRGLIVGDDDS